MAKADITTDHDVIRRWAEERGGCPASVEGTAPEHEPGLLRLDFRPKDDKLENVDWDAFFEKFEEAHRLLKDATAVPHGPFVYRTDAKTLLAEVAKKVPDKKDDPKK